MKRPTELAKANPRHKRRHLNTEDVQNFRFARGLSLLETLPAEILEQIFALSLNPNLAVASPFIGGVVSSERIYRAFMMYAFFDDEGLLDMLKTMSHINRRGLWTHHEDPMYNFVARAIALDKREFLPIQYAPINLLLRQQLQKSIMSCRWFTYNRFQSILARLFELIWGRQHTVYRYINSISSIHWIPNSRPWTTGHDVSEQEGLHDATTIQVHTQRLDAAWDRSDIGQYLSMHDRSQAPFLPLRIPILLEAKHFGREQDHMRSFFWNERSYCAVIAIPDRLVRWPISNEKIMILESLLETRTTLERCRHSWKIDLNVRTISYSIRASVVNGNVEALRILLTIVRSSCMPGTDLLRRTLAPDLCHAAVTLTPQARQYEVLNLLCRLQCDTTIPIIPRDDSALTAWAIRRQEGSPEDRFARQLLAYMEDRNMSRFSQTDSSPQHLQLDLDIQMCQGITNIERCSISLPDVWSGRHLGLH